MPQIFPPGQILLPDTSSHLQDQIKSECESYLKILIALLLLFRKHMASNAGETRIRKDIKCQAKEWNRMSDEGEQWLQQVHWAPLFHQLPLPLTSVLLMLLSMCLHQCHGGNKSLSVRGLMKY